MLFLIFRDFFWLSKSISATFFTKAACFKFILVIKTKSVILIHNKINIVRKIIAIGSYFIEKILAIKVTKVLFKLKNPRKINAKNKKNEI